MWLDLIAVALLFLFSALGAWRGALASGLGLLSLGLAYAAALGLGPRVAPWLEGPLGGNPLVAIVAASSACFFVSFVALGFGSKCLCRTPFAKRLEGGARNRFLGGSFGALRGVLVVLLVAYLALWLDALRVSGAAPDLPEVGDSTAANWTSDVVAGGVEAALGSDDATARLVARVASQPALAVAEVETLVDNPQFTSLRNDDVFWTQIEQGDVDAALNRSTFVRLAGDSELRRQITALGLVPDAAETDPEAFRDALADAFREVAPRLRGLKEDPALQSLIHDSEVIAMLQNGDTLGLLAHPDFRALVERAASAPTEVEN